MAVTRSGNTIVANAAGDTIAGPLEIYGIKCAAGASGMTVNLRKGTVAGNVIYNAVLAANATESDTLVIRFMSGKNIYVDIAAGSGSIYLFLL